MGRKRNEEKGTEATALYASGLSLAQVAAALGGTRQGIYKMLRLRGIQLRGPATPLPFVTFKGRRYTRRTNGYYAATEGDRAFLHRDIWTDAYGPIPRDHDVHHRDHNRAHNTLGNFELLSKSEHARQHAAEKKARSGGH